MINEGQGPKMNLNNIQYPIFEVNNDLDFMYTSGAFIICKMYKNHELMQ